MFFVDTESLCNYSYDFRAQGIRAGTKKRNTMRAGRGQEQESKNQNNLYCSIILIIVPCRCATRQCAQKCSECACATLLLPPSCLAAVYFHTVGSIPRVTKKSLIDGFQLSTRFWLFLSRVRRRGHWQSVSFEFPCT